jgi:hypothetical protein
MDGRAFLAVARRLAHEPTEADWRSAAGRAYYALQIANALGALLVWPSCGAPLLVKFLV